MAKPSATSHFQHQIPCLFLWIPFKRNNLIFIFQAKFNTYIFHHFPVVEKILSQTPPTSLWLVKVIEVATQDWSLYPSAMPLVHKNQLEIIWSTCESVEKK